MLRAAAPPPRKIPATPLILMVVCDVRCCRFSGLNLPSGILEDGRHHVPAVAPFPSSGENTCYAESHDQKLGLAPCIRLKNTGIFTWRRSTASAGKQWLVSEYWAMDRVHRTAKPNVLLRVTKCTLLKSKMLVPFMLTNILHRLSVHAAKSDQQYRQDCTVMWMVHRNSCVLASEWLTAWSGNEPDWH